MSHPGSPSLEYVAMLNTMKATISSDCCRNCDFVGLGIVSEGMLQYFESYADTITSPNESVKDFVIKILRLSAQMILLKITIFLFPTPCLFW